MMTKLAEEEFKELGISPSYGFLIMIVLDKPGIQPSEISEQLQLTPSTVTRLIEKLEFKGILERSTEGRTTKVHPTAEGKKMKRKLLKVMENMNRRYTETLGKKNADRLTSSIYQATEKLGKDLNK